MRATVRPTPVPLTEIPTPAVILVKKLPVEPIPTKAVESSPSKRSALRLVILAVEPTVKLLEKA